jgi:hypothetical protein
LLRITEDNKGKQRIKKKTYSGRVGRKFFKELKEGGIENSLIKRIGK